MSFSKTRKRRSQANAKAHTGKIMPDRFKGHQRSQQKQKEQGENRRCGRDNRKQDHIGCDKNFGI